MSTIPENNSKKVHILSEGIAESSSVYVPGYSDSSSSSTTHKRKRTKKTHSTAPSKHYSDSTAEQETYSLIASLAFPLDIGFDISKARIRRQDERLIFFLPQSIVVIVKNFFSFKNALPELVFAGTIIVTGEEFLSIFAHSLYEEYKEEQKNNGHTAITEQLNHAIFVQHPLLNHSTAELDDKVRSLFWDSLEIDQSFIDAWEMEEMESIEENNILLKLPTQPIILSMPQPIYSPERGNNQPNIPMNEETMNTHSPDTYNTLQDTAILETMHNIQKEIATTHNTIHTLEENTHSVYKNTLDSQNTILMLQNRVQELQNSLNSLYSTFTHSLSHSTETIQNILRTMQTEIQTTHHAVINLQHSVTHNSQRGGVSTPQNSFSENTALLSLEADIKKLQKDMLSLQEQYTSTNTLHLSENMEHFQQRIETIEQKISYPIHTEPNSTSSSEEHIVFLENDIRTIKEDIRSLQQSLHSDHTVENSSDESIQKISEDILEIEHALSAIQDYTSPQKIEEITHSIQLLQQHVQEQQQEISLLKEHYASLENIVRNKEDSTANTSLDKTVALPKEHSLTELESLTYPTQGSPKPAEHIEDYDFSTEDYALSTNIFDNTNLPEGFGKSSFIVDLQYHSVQKIIGTQWETDYGTIIIESTGSCVYTPSALTISHFTNSLIDSFNCTIKNSSDIFSTFTVSILLEELDEALTISVLPFTNITILSEKNILSLEASIYNPTAGDILYFDSELPSTLSCEEKNSSHIIISSIESIDDCENLIQKMCININPSVQNDRYIALTVKGYTAGVPYKKQRFYAVPYSEGITAYRIASYPEIESPVGTATKDENDDALYSLSGSLFDAFSLPEHLIGVHSRILSLSSHGVRHTLSTEWESVYGLVTVEPSGDFTYRLTNEAKTSIFQDPAIDTFECTISDRERSEYTITVAIELITISGKTCIRRMETHELLRSIQSNEEQLATIITLLNPAQHDILCLEDSNIAEYTKSADAKQLSIMKCSTIDACESIFSYVQVDISRNPNDLHTRFIAFSIDGYEQGVYHSTREIYSITPVQGKNIYTVQDFLPSNEEALQDIYTEDTGPITFDEKYNNEEIADLEDYQNYEEASEEYSEGVQKDSPIYTEITGEKEEQDSLNDEYTEYEQTIQEEAELEENPPYTPPAGSGDINLSAEYIEDSVSIKEDMYIEGSAMLTVQEALSLKRRTSGDLRIGGTYKDSVHLAGEGWSTTNPIQKVYIQGCMYKALEATYKEDFCTVLIADDIHIGGV